MSACLFLALRWAIGLIWIAAGAGKLGQTHSLEESVRQYDVLPSIAVPAIVRVLPAFEAVLGLTLVVGVYPAQGGFISAFLLCGLAGAIALNLARGRRFDCGCGFTTEATISWRLVARNILLAGFSMAIALGPCGALAGYAAGARHSDDLPAVSTLIAIPLTVMMVAVTVRVLVDGCEVAPGGIFPRRPTLDRTAANSAATLAVTHVDPRSPTA